MATVVGYDDPIDPVLKRELRVLAGHDALEEHLHTRHVPDALDVVPGHLIGGLALETAQCANHLTHLIRQRNPSLVLVTGVAPRVVLALEIRDAGALHGARADLAAAPNAVDRPDERRSPGRIDLSEGGLTGCSPLDSNPDGLSAKGIHLRELLRPRHDLQGILRPGGSSYGQVPFPVQGRQPAHGAQKDWGFPGDSKNLNRLIDLADAQQPAHFDLILREGLTVCPERFVVEDPQIEFDEVWNGK